MQQAFMAANSRTKASYKEANMAHRHECSTHASDSASDREIVESDTSDTWNDSLRQLSGSQETPYVIPPAGNMFQQKIVNTSVSANLPSDFAMAWSAAANVSGWKREEPDMQRPKGKKPAKKGNKSANTAQPQAAKNQGKSAKTGPSMPYAVVPDAFEPLDDCAVRDIPLPKWCTPPGLAMPPADHAAGALEAVPVGPVLGSMTLSASQDPAKLYFPGCDVAPVKVPAHCHPYLVNSSLPCKKRVPSWSL